MIFSSIMKFILLIVLITLGGINFQRLDYYSVSGLSLTSQFNQVDKRCEGISRRNKQCGNQARPGNNYCGWHEPTRISCRAIAKSTGRQCKNLPSPRSGYCEIHSRRN